MNWDSHDPGADNGHPTSGKNACLSVDLSLMLNCV